MSAMNYNTHQEYNREYICQLDQLLPNVGVAALLSNNKQVAVFRVTDTNSEIETIAAETSGTSSIHLVHIYAIDNIDPFAHAAVLSRGIIGDRQGTLCVFSPLLKQAFVLSSGVCLDDPTVQLQTYPVIIEDNKVFVQIV